MLKAVTTSTRPRGYWWYRWGRVAVASLLRSTVVYIFLPAWVPGRTGSPIKPSKNFTRQKRRRAWSLCGRGTMQNLAIARNPNLRAYIQTTTLTSSLPGTSFPYFWSLLTPLWKCWIMCQALFPKEPPWSEWNVNVHSVTEGTGIPLPIPMPFLPLALPACYVYMQNSTKTNSRSPAARTKPEQEQSFERSFHVEPRNWNQCILAP
jgi:hypothetical protein